ncbi:MAG: hypothetical protein WD648_10160 [Planctomycetaceae bacterium]
MSQQLGSARDFRRLKVAFGFVLVRLLVLRKLRDPNRAAIADGIPENEIPRRQLVEAGVDVKVVEREERRPNTFGPILEDAVLVGDRPKPDEEQPGLNTAFGQVLIEEKRGLDVAGSWHARTIRTAARDMSSEPT